MFEMNQEEILERQISDLERVKSELFELQLDCMQIDVEHQLYRELYCAVDRYVHILIEAKDLQNA